jgi:hypothetical protein
MELLNCEFCGKNFANRYNLNMHKKTAKYCLNLRGDEIPIINCEHCHLSFTTQSNLNAHIKNCKNRLKIENEQKFEELKEKLIENEQKFKELKEKLIENEQKFEEKLIAKNKKIFKLNVILENQNKIIQNLEKINQDHLKEIENINRIHKLELELAREKGCIIGMEKPRHLQTLTTSNNTNQKLVKIKTDNIKPFTVDLIKENLYKYDMEFFVGGIPKLVKFITDMIILKTDEGEERNYICTDISRNKFYRLIPYEKEETNKKWVPDGEALFLNNIIDELNPIVDIHWLKFKTYWPHDLLYNKNIKNTEFNYLIIDPNTKNAEFNDLVTEKNIKYAELCSKIERMYIGIKSPIDSKKRNNLIMQIRKCIASM